MGSTMAFGSTVGILTNRDLARQLAARQGYVLAGSPTTSGDALALHEPLVAHQGVMAWAYLTAFLWASDAGLNITLVVLDMLRGSFRAEAVVGTVILTAVGTLQVVLLFSIGMMCDQERTGLYHGKGEVSLPNEDKAAR
jgi:hypothetical protein